MTLQELYDNHPEWRHLHLAVYNDGELDFVGQSGLVYTSCDEEDNPILVVSGN